MQFDIFCRIIDNYGDAGVCWRLAKNLHDLGQCVRLWIDETELIAALCPDFERFSPRIQVLSWQAAARACPPESGVVIEAFACTPPLAYCARIAASQALWINLEYLGLEPWVEECHGLASPQAGGARKFFFFPGFSPRTGGLLRAPGACAPALPGAARAQRLGELCAADTSAMRAHDWCVSLFCYPSAPVAELLEALQRVAGAARVWLFAPQSLAGALRPGPKLQICPYRFLPQNDFDQLLRLCDLNLVRGEDSLISALWAGKPLVWQAYEQAHGAHLDKLQAWFEHAQLTATSRELHLAWNGARAPGDLTHSCQLALGARHWRRWQAQSRATSARLQNQTDLARQLLEFCKQKQAIIAS